jgi:putative drug exporter of the RND superfamily
MSAAPRAATGRVAGAYAALVVGLRYLVLLGWIAAVAAAVRYLPPLAPANGLVSLVPSNSPALAAEATATRLFGEPLDAPVAVVQRGARGLSAAAQAAAVRDAVAVDTGRAPGTPIPGLAGAVPIPNTGGRFPGSRERSTTVITFLYFRPGTPIATEVAGGAAYASRYASAPGDHLAGVTGVVPATYQQGVIIAQRLPWVELATVSAIWLIVGFFFLSAGAAVATLLCAAVSYLLAVRVVAWVAQQMHVAMPPDVQPVLVVLLLGVTTDYSVFFLSGMRSRLAEGMPRLQAARLTTAEFAPIILAAGLLVAAGTGSLAVARLQLIRAFGPGLAVTVVTAMAVSLTLAPALISVFGPLLFWPGPAWYRWARRSSRQARRRGGKAALPRSAAPWRVRERVAWVATAKPAALLIAAACVLGLLAVGVQATRLRIGAQLVTALPSDSQVARAQAAASKGFAAGILSPAELLVLGGRVGSQTAALARLQGALARQPGVAGVIGPATLPSLLAGLAGAGRGRIAAEAGLANPMLAADGDAARYGVIFRTDPLGPAAVHQVQELERRLPGLTAAAGLTGVHTEVGGETAAAGEAISSTTAGAAALAPILLAITFVLLAIFLNALVAPLYLLLASLLGLVATFGVTVWVCQHWLGYDGLVYYVPFTVAVLLISLGADYNVFVVGRIWEEARRRPLREAIAVAGSQASRAITVAGITLAASFALLALIPLQQFREVAVGMATGIVIDTVVVRSLLVPALVALFGRVGIWPGRMPPREHANQAGQSRPSAAARAAERSPRG